MWLPAGWPGSKNRPPFSASQCQAETEVTTQGEEEGWRLSVVSAPIYRLRHLFTLGSGGVRPGRTEAAFLCLVCLLGFKGRGSTPGSVVVGLAAASMQGCWRVLFPY